MNGFLDGSLDGLDAIWTEWVHGWIFMCVDG